jgi:hypothetical protein
MLSISSSKGPLAMRVSAHSVLWRVFEKTTFGMSFIGAA